MWRKKENTKMAKRKKEKDGKTIQESSNQFTPFRRVVFDWQFKEKAENVCGAGQGSRAKDYAVTQGRGLRRTSSFLFAWNQGGFWVA